MPIDLDRAVGAPLPTTTYTWTEEDLILYNLGVGAGDPPDDPAELKYTYEQGLVAVPSFGTIPPFLMMMGIGGVGGLDIDLARVLHGDQTLTVHRPIPTSGSVTQEGSITGIFDKGRGALIVLEMVSTLDSGEKLFTNRAGISPGERAVSEGTRARPHDATPPNVPRTSPSRRRHCHSKLSSIGWRPGTRTLCTPIRRSQHLVASSAPSFMVSAPTVWCARLWSRPASTGIRHGSTRTPPDSRGMSSPGRPW
jgi:hypothetical protein